MKTNPVSKVSAARDLIQAAKGEEVTAATIAAHVPGLAAKNVPATLEASVKRGEIGVRTNQMGVKFYFWQAARNANKAQVAAEIETCNAMTSVLKPMTRYGPGAHGVPFRASTVPPAPENKPANQPSTTTREDSMNKPVATAEEITKGIEDVKKQLEESHASLSQGGVFSGPIPGDYALSAPRAEKDTEFWMSDMFDLQIEQGAQAVTLSYSEVERLLAFVSKFHTA